jgi:hypothetical protein
MKIEIKTSIKDYMKKTYICALMAALGFGSFSAQAQIFSVGAGTDMSIKAGTVIGAEGLDITTSANYTLNGTALTRNANVVNTTTLPHILRSYKFSTTTAAFSGTLKMAYLDGELNGNAESSLKLIYRNATSWLTNNGSTVNTSLNFVQSSALSNVALNEVSAGQPVIIATTDSPLGGTIVQYSTNANYPTCYPIASTTAGATDSPESEYAGPDIWYRFTAQSTAAVVTMSSSTMDDAIALYSRDNGGNYIFVGSTNASTGAGDFERLVVSGLTPGTMYYASLGSSDGTSGAFQVCVQHLMPSGCASTSPVGGFSLCDAFKARYRGAASQGVTYDFTFFDEGYNTTNTLSGTNGLITLSNPNLGLRWGSLNDARVDVNYQLQNSAGTPVNVSVLGNVNEPSCQNFFIRNAPQLEVRTSQRCPASLFRSTWLAGQRVLNGTQACGAIGHTYEFTQVNTCNTEPVGLPITFNTAGASPYLQLGVLPNLSAQGAWKVRIASKYATINGINYTSDFGPEQYIVVNGTSAIEVLDEQEAIALAERNAELVPNTAMYPNPNSGSLLNLNITDVKSEDVYVRILDATGRMVYGNRYTAVGSLNTIIEVPAPLSSGMYMVECTVDGEVKTERLVVE